MITLPRETCIDLDQALNKEWLVSNGIGGLLPALSPG